MPVIPNELGTGSSLVSPTMLGTNFKPFLLGMAFLCPLKKQFKCHITFILFIVKHSINITCVWEGEMNLHYVAQIDGVEYSGKTGSFSKTDSTIESKLELEYKDMNPDGKCDEEIISV